MGTSVSKKVVVAYAGVFITLLSVYFVLRTTENSESHVNKNLVPVPTSDSLSWLPSSSSHLQPSTTTVAVVKPNQSNKVCKIGISACIIDFFVVALSRYF